MESPVQIDSLSLIKYTGWPESGGPSFFDTANANELLVYITTVYIYKFKREIESVEAQDSLLFKFRRL